VPRFALPGAVRFNDAVAEGARRPLAPAALGPDDLAVLQYTGGTTGVSKGAMLLHRNLVANMLQCEVWNGPALNDLKLPPGEGMNAVCALPLYHIFGFTTSLMLGLHLGSCNILIPNARDVTAMLRDLRGEKIHSFPAVNTLFNAVANHADFHTVDWSHLRLSVGGGMAVQQGTAALWLEKTGARICEGYGLSETSPVATCNPVDRPAVIGSIGLPLPGTDVVLLDDDGRAVAPGEPGEIGIRGPQLMAGYWKQPAETARAMTADGFFRTGDIGTVDAGGYFRVVDRKKDMIVRRPCARSSRGRRCGRD
jgi:long-chain acyl-CoA synthetase